MKSNEYTQNHKIKAKKKFGQHFLTDINIVNQMIEAASIKNEENIWEIGPGLGILTEQLIVKTKKLVAFEIDNDLIPILSKKYNEKFMLVHKDILDVNWSDYLHENGTTKLVANIPYQITSPLLYKIVDYREHFSKIVIMIQKEVAERLSAKPANKNYGVLTIKTQFYFNIELLCKVPASSFSPVPKVDSAVVVLTPRKDIPDISNLDYFWALVESCFRNRRKTLRNNLIPFVNSSEMMKLLETIPIDLNRRGETLSEEEYIGLYLFLSSSINSN